MNLLDIDVPRRVLALNVGVAALASFGIISLAGAQGLAVPAVPVLTALLTYALVVGTREPEGRTGRTGDSPTMDSLTGLPTADVGDETLVREFAAAQRGRPLTIVLIRLEGLVKYRARHGKTLTDQFLRVAGRTLDHHRRGMHLTARHGRGEGTFLSILSASDREGAAIYAARLRHGLMRLKGLPEHDGVSIGIASYDLSMASPSELLRKATYAMERGSAAGGKVVVMGENA